MFIYISIFELLRKGIARITRCRRYICYLSINRSNSRTRHRLDLSQRRFWIINHTCVEINARISHDCRTTLLQINSFSYQRWSNNLKTFHPIVIRKLRSINLRKKKIRAKVPFSQSFMQGHRRRGKIRTIRRRNWLPFNTPSSFFPSPCSACALQRDGLRREIPRSRRHVHVCRLAWKSEGVCKSRQAQWEVGPIVANALLDKVGRK